MAKNRVLITGAGGYIAAPVVEQLLSKLNVADGDLEYIIAVDRVGVPPNPDIVTNPNAEWINVNLDKVNIDWWEQLVIDNDITTIYYLESIENVNVYDSDSELNDIFQLSDFHFSDFLEKRVYIVSNPNLKVLYISTDKIYYMDEFPNEVHDIVLKDSTNSVLREARRYLYTYVASKALTEVKLQHTNGIDLRIIRPFSITGPERNQAGPLSVYINSALRGEDIQLYEDGTQGVAFTHVNDLVTLLIHENLFNVDIGTDLTSNVINFCRVQNYLSVKQLTEKIINKTESTSEITRNNPLNEFKEVQETPQIRNMVRIYQPQIPIEIILEDMIYELNPVNHYEELVIIEVILDEANGSIQILGAAEPNSSLVAWFGNGEVVNDEIGPDGKIDTKYTFEYPIDVYPIEIKITTVDLIQYATKIITL